MTTRRYHKAKGMNFQKWVADKIGELLSIKTGKDCLIQSRESSQSGVDVKLIGEALERFPFSIECKDHQKWAIHEFIKQAKSNVKEGTDWLLFIKKTHRLNAEKIPPVVVMDAETFFKLMGRINERGA